MILNHLYVQMPFLKVVFKDLYHIQPATFQRTENELSFLIRDRSANEGRDFHTI